MNERRIGVHVSIAGGIDSALERAAELGCTTVQMFSHNPRGWVLAKRNPEEIIRFRALKTSLDIRPVYIHTSYLVNLASSRQELFNRSVEMVVRELDIADEISAEYVVLHTGSASGEEPQASRKRAISALNLISGQGKWKAGLLLENTAGERGDITSRMAELAHIMNSVSPGLISGICLDTCHAFAAGYDIRGRDGLEGLVCEIRKYFGNNGLRLMHFNDSKKPVGAGVDRHEHLGDGTIGAKGLQHILAHPFFRGIPLILETPKKTEQDDPRNLAILKRMLRKERF